MKQVRITHAYGSQLDQGRKRFSNQDSIATAKINQLTEDDTRSIGIYIIADGVAQSPDGDIASKLAVDVTLHDVLANSDVMVAQGTYLQQMQQSVNLAHETIHRQYHDHANLPATTIVMALVIGTTAYILNVGDSRAYVLSDDTLRQITTDHTFAQVLLNAGSISEEQAINHPFRNALSQHLGGHDDFEADTFVENLGAGDYLLLCSDGLYNLVPQDKIIEIMQQAESPQIATKKLTQVANESGGKDNIAVIVVEMMERN